MHSLISWWSESAPVSEELVVLRDQPLDSAGLKVSPELPLIAFRFYI